MYESRALHWELNVRGFVDLTNMQASKLSGEECDLQ